MITTTKFHVILGKRRTTITVDTIIASLLALKLGYAPETKEAYKALREYFQEKLDAGKDPGRALVSYWLQEKCLFELIDSGVAKKYWKWFEKQKWRL